MRDDRLSRDHIETIICTGGDGAYDDDDRYPHLRLPFFLSEGAFRRETLRREQGRREQRQQISEARHRY